MDKGGKGFSLPKSSLKSAPAKNGKDDSSPKLKAGRKVQFNYEGSPEPGLDFSSKSNGKFGASADKGGKGSTAANGKASKSKDAQQPLELRIEQELLKNAECIMDCEAAEILQGIHDQMILLSRDPTIKLPVSFDKGLQYAQANARYENPQSVRRVLETLKKHGVLESEISVIGNVCPETVDEVFALVPSLKSKRSTLKEPLEIALKELTQLRKSD